MKRRTLKAGSLAAVLALPAIAHAQDVGPLVFFVALAAVGLGAISSVVLKFVLLSRSRHRQSRPRLVRFVGIGLVDFAIWVLALPASLALRFGTAWVYKEYLAVALILAFAVGYTANYVAFHRAVTRGSGSVTFVSLALVLLLTLLMPLLIILFALLMFWIGSFI